MPFIYNLDDSGRGDVRRFDGHVRERAEHESLAKTLDTLASGLRMLHRKPFVSNNMLITLAVLSRAKRITVIREKRSTEIRAFEIEAFEGKMIELDAKDIREAAGMLLDFIEGKKG